MNKGADRMARKSSKSVEDDFEFEETEQDYVTGDADQDDEEDEEDEIRLGRESWGDRVEFLETLEMEDDDSDY